MRIGEFLKENVSPDWNVELAYQSDICAHLDGLLFQLWLLEGGRILVVSGDGYREFAEGGLLPSLRARGVDVEYCLCVVSAGVDFESQIGESLGDGRLFGLCGIVSLGDSGLFRAVCRRAEILGVPCCALLPEFAPHDLLDGCGGGGAAVSGIYFDLDRIADAHHGDYREAVSRLEFENYAIRADLAASEAMSCRYPAPVWEALSEAMPPRMKEGGLAFEEDLAQLCEAYAWRAAAVRLMHERTGLSFETVWAYGVAMRDCERFGAASHARLLALVFEAACEMEALEIAPDACAGRQPPQAILARTLRQILLEDGVNFEWLTRGDANFEDRVALRNKLHVVAMNWDEFCAHLRPIADMMHAVAASERGGDEMDHALKMLWIHAARFAPKCGFLKLFNDMGLLESSLYL